MTARDSESDQILGLEMGADEYVSKPFSPITLIARIKALHRRAQISALGSSKQNKVDDDFDVKTDHFKLNSSTREAYLNDNRIDGLTPKEFDLLRVLAKSHVKYFLENNYCNWYGIMNTMVMKEQLMHILKS